MDFILPVLIPKLIKGKMVMVKVYPPSPPPKSKGFGKGFFKGKSTKGKYK